MAAQIRFLDLIHYLKSMMSVTNVFSTARIHRAIQSISKERKEQVQTRLSPLGVNVITVGKIQLPIPI